MTGAVMEIKREKLFFDVCVIGGAGSGLTAGLRAKENGAKKVLIIDKMKIMGGTTRFCTGFMALETPHQKRLGVHDTVDEVFSEYIRMTYWHCNAKLVRKWFMQSADLVCWLEHKGVRFKADETLTDRQGKYQIMHNIEGRGNQLINTLLDACQKEGVELMTETRGTRLLTDETGAVDGVVAIQGDKELDIQAKSVIIATGSIAYNQELLERFYPGKDFSHVKIMNAVPHNTGDGLLMAEAVGAGNGHMSTLYIGPHNHPSNMRVGNIMRRPMMLYLNRNGERFVDESIPTHETFPWMRSIAMELQPDRMCFPMMDESIFREMLRRRENLSSTEARQGISKRQDHLATYGQNAQALEPGMDDPCGWLDMLEDDFKDEIARGKDARLAIFNTLDEVAEYIGVDPTVLKTSVAEYNRSCEIKYDGEFLKDPKYLWPLTKPPYYVFKGYQGIDTPVGGILIDHNMRVLDKRHYPIKNLYAAGVCTSGWANNGYGFAGTCLGSSLFGGFSAGKLAAEEAVKQV
jgi:fumarate reductase flavoprotein subunit